MEEEKMEVDSYSIGQDTNMKQLIQEFQENQQGQNTTSLSKEGVDLKKQNKYKMPIKFYLARKEINNLIEEYFSQLKNQYLIDNPNSKPDININYRFLSDIKRNMVNYVSLEPPRSLSISRQDTKSPIYIYCPEELSILQYNPESSIKRKRIDNKTALPHMGTPIIQTQWVYILDGSTFCQKKKVFVPALNPIKIHIYTQEVKILELPKQQKIKSAVFKDQSYIYVLSGFFSNRKLKSSSCEKFDLKTQKWESMPSLNRAYGICSGCIFNNDIYLLAKEGIQRLRENKWQILPLPFNMNMPSFNFTCQINPKQIAIIGGWYQCTRLNQIMIYEPEKNICTLGASVLPCPVSSEKISGCILKENKIHILSPVCYSIDKQFGFKKGAFQHVVIGNNCILKSIISA